jgi:hypothetical protein
MKKRAETTKYTSFEQLLKAMVAVPKEKAPISTEITIKVSKIEPQRLPDETREAYLVRHANYNKKQ